MCQHARASPLPQKIPDFCWLRLQQEDNSQTTGWRWTQPAQSSLRLSVFLTVRLTPHCLPWFSSPLPLTTESCLSSNAKRMRISLSSYLEQHSWTWTKMIRPTGFTVFLASIWQEVHTFTTVLRKKENHSRVEMKQRKQKHKKKEKKDRWAVTDSCCPLFLQGKVQ